MYNFDLNGNLLIILFTLSIQFLFFNVFNFFINHTCAQALKRFFMLFHRESGGKFSYNSCCGLAAIPKFSKFPTDLYGTLGLG